MPRNAIILARISDARDGGERGVTGQVSDGLALAARLGWGTGPPATHHIIENDTSAYKRKRIAVPGGGTELRTVRPAFREALAMLAGGRADGLIAYDLDRTARDPRDLEDLIDVIEASRPRIPAESVTGSLRLATDADITMARVMVAIANKSSRDTARRVARARKQQAAAGRFGGGKRRYGFGPDGITVREDEAAEIRSAAGAILAGVSLRQVTAGLRDRGVPTVTGAAWNTITVRDILLRPRNAGLMVHRPSGGREGPPYSDGEIAGKAPWDPIIPADEWRAVAAILTDPARRRGPGGVPRYLGSGIYLCGRCGDGTTLAIGGSGTGQRRVARYTCFPDRQLCDAPPGGRRWHLARVAMPADRYVQAVLVTWLASPEAARLIPAAGQADVAGLRAEAAALRELLDELGRSFARRRIDRRQMEAGTGELRADLDRAEAALAAAASSSPLAWIAGRPDAAAVWAGLDLGRRRALLRKAAVVTLLPGRPGPRFDPATVRVEPRQPGG